MTNDSKQFRTFEDLQVYQVAREFRKAMYAVTRRLPAFEKFDLASQVRLAAPIYHFMLKSSTNGILQRAVNPRDPSVLTF
jgi:hypothetical protein